jgi:NADPH:quinone reductase-like Zn-dependent oxidoreductase
VILERNQYKLVDVEIPKPGKGQALIKVAYSTVNPTDRISFGLAGTGIYTPDQLGSDGSGVVVEVGEGVDQSLVGKKVSFVYNAWSRYTVKEASLLIIFDDD